MNNNYEKKTTRKFHVKSIQAVITFVFAVLIAGIIIIVGVLSYYTTGNIVKDNSTENVYQLVRQVNYNIEYYLGNVEDIALSFQYNKDIQAFLLYDSDNNEELAKNIREQLNTVIETRTDVNSIALISDTGKVVINNHNLKIKDDIDLNEQMWYQKALSTGKFEVSDSHVQNLLVGKYDWVVSCSTVLKKPDNQEFMGMLLIDINYNIIEDMVSKIVLGDKGYIFIINEEGNIVYHPKQQLLYSNIKEENIELILNSNDGNVTVEEDGLEKQYTIATSKYSGWRVVGAVYIEDILKYKPYLRNFFVIMSLIAVSVAIIIAILVSSHILSPIKGILEGMKRFQDGDLDINIKIKQENEISEIAKAFNSMTGRIKTLVSKNKEIEKAKRKSELKALQSQINPHFLYNTLDSIVWMSEAGKNNSVIKMTSSLAKLFRISISKGKEFITIKEEIEHIESYLTIQKVRYGDKLQYEIIANEKLLNYKIIKIVIQPIVENAIYHGIKKLSGQGKIKITIDRIENRILIKVEDNGMGMDRETIKKVLENKNEKGKKLGGVGIKNVDDRIKLNYGDDYGICFESELFEGTIVKIWLPLEK